ncbi:MAG: hypothetical protein AAGE65_04935 [Planctomycetota bacterium]
MHTPWSEPNLITSLLDLLRRVAAWAYGEHRPALQPIRMSCKPSAALRPNNNPSPPR